MYIEFTKTSVGTETDYFGYPTSSFTFLKGEIFELIGYYNYYSLLSAETYITCPVIKLNSEKGIIKYEIPPDCYIEFDDPNLKPTQLTFTEKVKRSKLFYPDTKAYEYTANMILNFYKDSNNSLLHTSVILELYP